MLVFIFAGISFGLSAGFSPGPLFAMVISQTVQYGLKEGVKTALSPLITDLPIILLSTFLLSKVSGYNIVLGLISVAGGFFLMFLSYENIKIAAVETTIGSPATGSVLKGAIINALSPHPYLFWIMVGSPIILNAHAQGWPSVLCFVASFYVSLIGAKTLLALIVNRSRSFLQGNIYLYMMKALGILLLLFACLLFKEGVELLLK